MLKPSLECPQTSGVVDLLPIPLPLGMVHSSITYVLSPMLVLPVVGNLIYTFQNHQFWPGLAHHAKSSPYTMAVLNLAKLYCIHRPSKHLFLLCEWHYCLATQVKNQEEYSPASASQELVTDVKHHAYLLYSVECSHAQLFTETECNSPVKA